MPSLSAHLSSPGNTALTAESGLAPCQPEPTDRLESWLQKFKAYRQLSCGGQGMVLGVCFHGLVSQ